MDIDDAVIGATAGMAATGPMTLVMEAIHRALPQHERDVLPPRRIVENLLESTGQRHEFAERHEFALTLLSHFAYGGAVASVYPTIKKQLDARAAIPEPLGGIAFGLAVWAASYAGVLPALGLYPPPQRETARRNALMIGAHVIWGASMGLLAGALKKTSGSRPRIGSRRGGGSLARR